MVLRQQRASRADINCAIDAIAELGYANATLAEIARRAGISKGVVSYHFTDKRELIRMVVSAILNKATAVMLVIARREAAKLALLLAEAWEFLEVPDSRLEGQLEIDFRMIRLVARGGSDLHDRMDTVGIRLQEIEVAADVGRAERSQECCVPSFVENAPHRGLAGGWRSLLRTSLRIKIP